MIDTKRQFWVMRHSDDVMERIHHLAVDCSPPRLLIRNADAFVEYLENDWATAIDDPSTGCSRPKASTGPPACTGATTSSRPRRCSPSMR